MEILNLLNTIKKQKQNIEGRDSNISLWKTYYNGYDVNFHKYSVFNGTEYIYVIKKSLKMGKRICEDWASLLWSEKLDLALADKDKLYPLLYKLRFWELGNKAVEIGFALSLSALTIEFKGMEFNEDGTYNKNKSNIELLLGKYNAQNIIPITYENGVITECAFVCDNSSYTQTTIHLLDEQKKYHIYICKENKADKKQRPTIFDINTMSSIPLFAIIQPNLENNIDLNSNKPISVFANAIDQIQAVDNKYDAFDSEFVLGRKRIYVSAEMNKMVYLDDGNGGQVASMKRTFDGSDQVIYQLPQAQDGKPLIWSPNDQLRANDLIMGLQTELQMLGSKCGLGNDYYNYEKGRVMTATQVVSEKSDTFRNMKKHQLLLENSIKQIVMAIIYANNTFTNNPTLTMESPQVIFDDSIIEDKESEKTSDRTDVQNGVMSKIEYRMKWYGEDEQTARQKIYDEYGNVDLVNRITGLMDALTRGVINAKMFIKYVFTKDDIASSGMSEDELAEYIEERIKSGESISADDLVAMGGYNPPINQNE